MQGVAQREKIKRQEVVGESPAHADTNRHGQHTDDAPALPGAFPSASFRRLTIARDSFAHMPGLGIGKRTVYSEAVAVPWPKGFRGS